MKELLFLNKYAGPMVRVGTKMSQLTVLTVSDGDIMRIQNYSEECLDIQGEVFAASKKKELI